MPGPMNPSRVWRPVLAAVLVAVAAVTACEDEMAPVNDVGTVSFQPVFPSRAAASFPFATARIVLTRIGDETPTIDTLVALEADQDTVALAFPVMLVGDNQFLLNLDLRDSSGTTLFSAVDTVTALPGTGGAPPLVPLDYVGIGADAAAVQIVNTVVFVAVGDTTRVTANALDTLGEPIEGTPILWSTTDSARAYFPSRIGGSLVGGDSLGPVSVVAELFTGPADTVGATVLAAGTGNVLVAIDSLEDALFLLVAAVDDTAFARQQVVDWAAADQFSFETSRALFEQAYNSDMTNDTAAFGLAVTTILALKDDPTFRSLAQQWDDWQAQFPFGALDSLFQGSAPFPPSFSTMQALVRNVVLPALRTSIDALNTIDDPNFLLILTDRMQGRTGSIPPDEIPREIDYADVLFLKALLNGITAFADGLVAYQLTPDPFGAGGVDAAFATGSTFLTLATGGATNLADARTRLQDAVTAALAAFDVIELETDDQSNDVIVWNPLGTCCPSGLADLSSLDLVDGRRVFGQMSSSLQGPFTWNEDFSGDSMPEMVTIDITALLLSPVSDLKTLLPSYFTSNGQFFWTALSVDEWMWPDPTLAALLPGMATSDSLVRTLDLRDLWDGANQDIDEWSDISTHAAAAANLALTSGGRFHGIAPDFSGDSAGPSLPPPDTLTFASYRSIASNSLTGEQWAWDNSFNGNIYTRPNDVATGWTLRTTLCCGGDMIESPVAAGAMFLYDGFSVNEVSSDLLTVTLRAQNFAGGDRGFAVNFQNNELVVLDFLGNVHVWNVLDAAPVGTFTQVFTLPIPSTEDPFFAEWVDLTGGPNGNLWFITRNGGLVELLADYSAAFERPAVPTLDEVVAISQDVSNTVLIALTTDGKLFTRPADATTPWTLARTLTRYLNPIP